MQECNISIAGDTAVLPETIDFVLHSQYHICLQPSSKPREGIGSQIIDQVFLEYCGPSNSRFIQIHISFWWVHFPSFLPCFIADTMYHISFAVHIKEIIFISSWCVGSMEVVSTFLEFYLYASMSSHGSIASKLIPRYISSKLPPSHQTQHLHAVYLMHLFPLWYPYAITAI